MVNSADRTDVIVRVSFAAAAVWAIAMALAGGQVSFYMSHIGVLVAPAFATGASVLAARRAHPSVRRTFWFLAAACFSWTAGETIYSLYELVLHQEPFPSPADIGYLGLIPLALLAMFVLPGRKQSGRAKLGVIIEGLVISASLTLVFWVLVLETAITTSDDPFPYFVATAYPIGDLVIVAAVLAVIGQALKEPALPPRFFGFIGLGLFSIAAADSLFFYMISTDAYFTGAAPDGGWVIGFVLIAMAARTAPGPEESVTEVSQVQRRAATAAPYVTVAAAILVAGYVQITEGALDAFVVWTLALTLGLLSARQLVAVLDNHDLARTLEERVIARTRQLESTGKRFQSLVQNSSDVIIVVGEQGRVTYISPAAERVFGLERTQVEGSHASSFLHPDDSTIIDRLIVDAETDDASETVEFRVIHRDDSVRHCEATVTNLVNDSNVLGLVFNARDITVRKELESKLEHQAFHDSLTGLLNRARFNQNLTEALARHRLSKGHLAVFFCDLDGFKRVNDSLGHTVGDELIKRIAQRISHCLRPGDTVARIGGDEFALVLENITNDAEVNAVAERLVASVRQPVSVSGREMFVTTSIGIAVSDGLTISADDLLRNADIAMYSAKAQGTGVYQRYEATMRSPVEELIGLETDLRKALADEQIRVQYQPKVRLDDSAVTGFEALARWHHPDHGHVSPEVFVRIAEQSDLIAELGAFILRSACAQTVAWHAFWPSEELPAISVNLSARQLRQANVVANVRHALDESGLAPEFLTLELTESILIEHDVQTASTLQQLRDMGVKIAIDDFGTGYSSLSYLHRFPVDILKIDRAFVDFLLQDSTEKALASVIIRIGAALDLVTVAEGVEHPTQLEALKEMGCTMGQGYLFSKPLPPENITELIRQVEDVRWESLFGSTAAELALQAGLA